MASLTKKIVKIRLIIPALVSLFSLYAQQALSQTDTTNNYEGYTLQDLLNVKIVSVSKNTEMLFDAPLSASVLTKDEIKKAGSTSIMDALRLVPGMIIREQANGNYDIHLRGMDNVPPNAAFDITSNTTTLVMIDNRPIYSYLKGGTFWETLPVDLNDVERIEVVRGPAAALYGPNAVNGVINIITSRGEGKGIYVNANSRYGSLNSWIQNASLGYRQKKWSATVSGNYQHRDRGQTSYFEYIRNRWIDDPEYLIGFMGDTATNIAERYPHPELAMKKYAGNIFLTYDPKNNMQFSFSSGTQFSIVQKVSVENEATPLSTAGSSSRYADFRARVQNISAQVSYNTGTQNVNYDRGNKYDFRTVDVSIEYEQKFGRLSLKPGFSYRSAVYDDTPYSDLVLKTGIFNARGEISSRAASLRSEYTLFEEKLRLVAGASANTFNYPDKTYAAYQFAGTFKPNKKHLFRAVFSKAPRSSNIFDTYVNQTIAYYPVGPRNFVNTTLAGNKNIELLTSEMLEVGYRSSLSYKLSLDIEAFNIHTRNVSSQVMQLPVTTVINADTISTIAITPTNLPAYLNQQGVTISLTYSGKKIQFRPFVTLQKTILRDYAPSNTVEGMGPVSIYSGKGTKTKVESTPTAFGGASFNYVISRRLNFNLNAYAYGSQTYYHLSNIIFNDGVRGIDHIPAKLLLNANVSYKAFKGLQIFCSAKNILNDNSREFFGTDNTPFMLFTGASLQLKK